MLQTAFFFKKDSLCKLSDVGISQSCLQLGSQEVSYTVPLPFIYSDQCRNALFRNYIPTILYSCAYSTFGAPIFYLWLNSYLWNVKEATAKAKADKEAAIKAKANNEAAEKAEADKETADKAKADNEVADKSHKTQRLDEKFPLFCFKTSMRTWVLYDVTYSFVEINVELILLLFFGIVSPFCAVALWASAASGILLLRLQIYRYYLLQSEDFSNIGSVVYDKHHIEVMCGNALKYLHIFIQPLLLLTLMFGLYLFEMAYDGANGSIIVSICLLILITFTTLTAQSLVLWSRRARLDSIKQTFNLDKTNDSAEKILELRPSEFVRDSSERINNTSVTSPLHNI